MAKKVKSKRKRCTRKPATSVRKPAKTKTARKVPAVSPLPKSTDRKPAIKPQAVHAVPKKSAPISTQHAPKKSVPLSARPKKPRKRRSKKAVDKTRPVLYCITCDQPFTAPNDIPYCPKCVPVKACRCCGKPFRTQRPAHEWRCKSCSNKSQGRVVTIVMSSRRGHYTDPAESNLI